MRPPRPGGPIPVPDRGRLGAFLGRDRRLYLYLLGDLDEPWWSRCDWFAREERGELVEVAMLYRGPTPTLLALSHQPERMARLVSSVLPELPGSFHCHLSPGVGAAFGEGWILGPAERCLRMTLEDRDAAAAADASGTVVLSASDTGELLELYRESYPESWFDPRMLSTGLYRGLREEGRLVSAAGVHVFSEEQGVAALGNIATRPEHRGRGYGTRVTAALTHAVMERARTVGLNVKEGNGPAMACYRRLGFRPAALYTEVMARSRDRGTRGG